MSVDPQVFGYAMSSYFGGRAECRIRRVPVPVVLVDYVSMYPTVNSLLDLFSLVAAKDIRVVDTTAEAVGFLSGLAAEEMFRQERWRDLLFFAEIEPQGDILPVRARYDAARQGYGIGVNPVSADQTLWYAGPDLAAATILGERPPKIRRALRLVPRGRQRDLGTVALRGKVPVDFANDDFFRIVVEERKRSTDEDLAFFLKIFINAISYGAFAEMNPEELPIGQKETVDLYGRTGHREWKSGKPEKPGQYCFPPFAALVTAGARLMLALLEHSVVSRGGTYAACDTDSMMIVASPEERLVPCRGGPLRDCNGREAVNALSWSTVDEIVDEFTALNPYDQSAVPGSILEVEKENFVDGQQTELSCYSISAKRYVLFRRDRDGIDVVKRMEHGLGHLLNPLDPNSESRDWITEIWRYLVEKELGIRCEEPNWLDRMAVSRLQVSTPDIMDRLQDGRPYAQSIKPANFLVTAHVRPFGHPDGIDPLRFQLIAPFERDPLRWLTMDWTEKYSGLSYQVTTASDATSEMARVRSFRDVVAAYATHPEPKSCDPSGQPCDRRSTGLLGRRPVLVRLVREIGKEANRLEELASGQVQQISDVMEQYDDRRGLWEQLRPVVRKWYRSEAADILGITKRQLRNLINSGGVPSESGLLRLQKALDRKLFDAPGPAQRNSTNGRGVG